MNIWKGQQKGLALVCLLRRAWLQELCPKKCGALERAFHGILPWVLPFAEEAGNKLQSALYWLSFVWPAKESWSSALPFVLQCLCRLQGEHFRNSADNGCIITPSALRQARIPGLRGCYCKQMSYLNHSSLDQGVICLYEKAMITLTKCGFRK